MKKLSVLVLVFLVVFQIISCKSDKKKEVKKEEKASIAAFVLSKAKNSVDWIAYKTTEKIPVKGKFKKVTITSGGEGESIKGAIHNAEFSIPVSSIFTSDTSRDYKIRKFFFGIMEATELLSGKLVIEDETKGYAEITMNGITEKLPFSYEINGKEFKMSATMNILKWNAKHAIDSLNDACKDLHKGLDGITKTWSEVTINISSIFE